MTSGRRLRRFCLDVHCIVSSAILQYLFQAWSGAVYLFPEGSVEEDPKRLPNFVLRIYWICITPMDDKVELCLWVTLLRIQRLKSPWGLGVSIPRRKTRGLHITFVEFIFTWHTILCTGQDWKISKSCNFCPCCCHHNIVVFVVSIKQHFLAITQILECTTQSQKWCTICSENCPCC